MFGEGQGRPHRVVATRDEQQISPGPLNRYLRWGNQLAEAFLAEFVPSADGHRTACRLSIISGLTALTMPPWARQVTTCRSCIAFRGLHLAPALDRPFREQRDFAEQAVKLRYEASPVRY